MNKNQKALLTILTGIVIVGIALTALPLKENVTEPRISQIDSAAAQSVILGPNLVSNSSFDSGVLSPWYMTNQLSATSYLASVDSAIKIDGAFSAKIEIKTKATTPYSIQLSQKNIPLILGKNYTYSFYAKSDIARNITTTLQGPAPSYTTYFTRTIPLTSQWQNFTYSFSSPVTQSDIAIRFDLAESTGSLWFDKVTLSTQTISTPTPTPAPTSTLLPSPLSFISPYDKGVHWTIGRWYNSTTGYNMTGLYHDLDVMKAAGINWVRFVMHKGTGTGLYDKLVPALKERNMKWLAQVNNPNRDANGKIVAGTDAQRADYKAWLSMMVNRYKSTGVVKVYEIHNEPNLSYFWNIDQNTTDNVAYSASVADYVKHLQDGYNAVKASDPQATVVFGGLSQWKDERYVDELVKLNPSAYYDVMGFHPYGSSPDKTIEEINTYRQHVSANIQMAAKPILITEYGYTLAPGEGGSLAAGSTENTRASYLVDSMNKIKAKNISPPYFWYNFNGDNDGSITSGSGYELLFTSSSSLSDTVTPAFTALKNLWSSFSPEPTSTNSPAHSSTPTIAPTPTPRSSTPPVGGISTPTPTPLSTPIPTIISTPQPCSIVNASWVISSILVNEGTSIPLRVNTVGSCSGKQVSFQVLQDNGLLGNNSVSNNPLPVTIQSNNSASSFWVSEYHPDIIGGLADPPEYFFLASIAGQSQTIRSDNPEIQVTRSVSLATPSPSVPVSPSPTPQAVCQLTKGSWIISSNPVPSDAQVSLKINTSGECEGKQVLFEVREDDGLLGSDPVSQNPETAIIHDNYAQSIWAAQYQSDGNGLLGDPEYFFNAVLVGQSSTTRSESPNLVVQKSSPVAPSIPTISTTNSNSISTSSPISSFKKTPDLNKDGQVNIFDLSILLRKWNTSTQDEDLNDDGQVNIFDLSILLRTFGK